MKKNNVIVGQHRNAGLAERHRRALERKTGGAVEIVARRNADGKTSKRGRFFTFVITPKRKKRPVRPKQPKLRGEYAIKTTYARKGIPARNRLPVMTDIRIQVRRARTEATIKKAIKAFVIDEEPLPSWLSIKTYSWDTTGDQRSGDADDFRGLFWNGVPYEENEMEILEAE